METTECISLILSGVSCAEVLSYRNKLPAFINSGHRQLKQYTNSNLRWLQKPCTNSKKELRYFIAKHSPVYEFNQDDYML